MDARMNRIIDQCWRELCISMGDDPDREGDGVLLTGYRDSVIAVLTKFKELTEEPTSAMIEAGALKTDDIYIERGRAIECFTKMQEQMYKDIGI
jgi:hypothetical protein